MAVTFGRIGTTRVGGGARLVCTPDLQIVVPPAPDVTPNPTPNWTDISYNIFNSYSTQQIQGISTSITLEVSSAFTQDLYVKIDNTSPFYEPELTPDDYGFTKITTLPYTFVVSNNQYITFACGGLFSDSATITIKNNSDGATILDTFVATTIGPG